MEFRSHALAAAGAFRPQCFGCLLPPQPPPPRPRLLCPLSRLSQPSSPATSRISLDADRCKYAAGYALHILAGGGATCYSLFSIDTLHGHPLQAVADGYCSTLV
ncbi:hypothetical protein ACQJBY_028560 [Aegilops geniculata]